MKKAFCILLSILIIFSLSSCGNKSTLNQSETKAVKKVITSIDDYLDYKITKDELKTVVREVQSRLKSNSTTIDKQSSKTVDELVSELDSSTVKLMLSNLSLQLSMVGLTKDDDEIERIRNKLAEKVGEKPRNR